jgi:hypothetical protein
MLTTTIVVCFSVALAALAVALVRQVRLQRATRRLLGRFLQHRSKPRQAIASTIALAGLGGCSHPDARLGELASQVTHDQAEQNQRISEGSKAVAQGSQHLVEADAQARRDLIELQHSLRQDQAEIGQHRDALEAERKAIASQRRSDSAIASGLVIFGVILTCLAPLILAGFSLLGLWREPTREEEGEVLVEELVQSLVDLPAPQAVALPEAPPSPPGLPSTEGRD